MNDRKGKTENIYFNYREDNANIQWKGNDTVVVNGHTLTVPNEKFDYRNQ